ncbi:MAG: lipid-A-disaccharide synthase, partial [Dysgonamonadaceae bacterium]|nr:lipid-A-disaccharide synthase [Dysgonamonadaceae bacterium]
GIEEDFYDNTINNNNVNLIFGQTYNILAQAQAALVTSGTATLEAALLNTPQVVCYRTPVPRLAYFGFRYLLHTPYISLVNLIADKEVVKELFAKFFTIKNIREETEKLLFNATYRTQMLDEYAEIQQLLGDENASDKAAQLIYDKISH